MKKSARKTKIDTGTLVQRCYDYLGTQQVVLWGLQVSIADDAGQHAAAEWLAGEITAVMGSDG